MKPAAYVSTANLHCHSEAILADFVGFENGLECLACASHAPIRSEDDLSVNVTDVTTQGWMLQWLKISEQKG